MIRIATYAPVIKKIDTYPGIPRTRDVLEKMSAAEKRADAQRASKIRERARYQEPEAERRESTEADRRL